MKDDPLYQLIARDVQRLEQAPNPLDLRGYRHWRKRYRKLERRVARQSSSADEDLRELREKGLAELRREIKQRRPATHGPATGPPHAEAAPPQNGHE